MPTRPLPIGLEQADTGTGDNDEMAGGGANNGG